LLIVILDQKLNLKGAPVNSCEKLADQKKCFLKVFQRISILNFISLFLCLSCGTNKVEGSPNFDSAKFHV